MNYHLLEYSELKQEAKERRIKLYYVMKKAKLVELLSMKELPEIYIVEKKRISELRAEARARGMVGIYMLTRSALVELLYPHLYGETSAQYKNQHHNNADKHNPPKSHYTKEVRV